MQNIPVATGASSNHFIESLAMIASFQQVFPDDKMYFYNLGLGVSELESVCMKTVFIFIHRFYEYI